MDDVTCAPRPFPASRETVAVRQPRPVGAWRSPTHVRPRFLPLKFINTEEGLRAFPLCSLGGP